MSGLLTSPPLTGAPVTAGRPRFEQLTRLLSALGILLLRGGDEALSLALSLDAPRLVASLANSLGAASGGDAAALQSVLGEVQALLIS